VGGGGGGGANSRIYGSFKVKVGFQFLKSRFVTAKFE